MNNEVIIIQDKLNVLMRAISKIIEISLKINSHILLPNEINYKNNYNPPKLLIIDETILEENYTETINKIKYCFPKTNVLVVSIGSNNNIKSQLETWHEAELIDLWKHNGHSFEILVFTLQRKLKL